MKQHIKKIVLGIAYFLMSPFLLAYWCSLLFFSKDNAITVFSQCLSLLPGISGSYLRKAFFNLTLKHCSVDTFIGFGTLISQQAVSIGGGVYIGPQCNLGQCDIGERTLLGSAVHILSGRHQHSHDASTSSLKTQDNMYQTVKVGQDCWIGNAAIVMADVGGNSVIGAGAVVVKPIPPNSVAVGNPARVIKENLFISSD